MKRFVVCLAALVGLTVFCRGVAQAAVRYELEEVGISIELPEDYTTITRDTPADDPAYEAYIWDKETMDALFEQQDSYLNSSSLDYSKEISVTMIPMPIIKDFSWLNEANLETIAASFPDALEEMGGTYLRSELYQHSQVKFIKIYAEVTLNGDSYDMLKYYTVYDSKAININFFSYVEALDEEDEVLIRSVVDSARFGEEAIAAADLREYTDLETGLSFTVPEGWSQADMLPGHQVLKAKFLYDQDPDMMIAYGVVDTWSNMSNSEKVGLERWDVDQSYLTADDIADTYGVDAGDVSVVVFGGKEYYVANINLGAPLGADLGEYFNSTVLLRIENGYMFQFFCDAKFADPQFKDMKALLDSARYPEPVTSTRAAVPTVPPVLSADPAYNYTRDTGREERNAQMQFALAAIAFAVIGVAALLLWDWFRRKRARDGGRDPAPTSSFVPVQDTPAAEPVQPAPEALAETATEAAAAEESGGYCPQCGMRVPGDARFCHRCGGRLKTEENGENNG